MRKGNPTNTSQVCILTEIKDKKHPESKNIKNINEKHNLFWAVYDFLSVEKFLKGLLL